MKEFEYYAPGSWEEALQLKAKYGNRARILAGGTDLCIQMMERKVTPEAVISLKNIAGLANIAEQDGYLLIGGACKFAQIEKSDVIKTKFNVLYEAVSRIGAPQIRNMATIGGNICNAAAAADTVGPLLVLEAEAEIASAAGTRIVKIENFITGSGTTILKDEEILKSVRIPLAKNRGGSCYLKLGLRKSMEIARLAVAVYLQYERNEKIMEDVRIAFTAVAPSPFRVYEIEKRLQGQK